MGRKSVPRKRKAITAKTNRWLAELLTKLQEEDIEQVTIDDMALLAGKSKSTIYEYFESKEDILEAACLTRVQLLTETIFNLNLEELGTVDRYRQLIELFAEGTTGISIAFLQSIKQHYPKAWSVIQVFIDQFVALLKEHYQQGINEGMYNPISVELLGHIDELFVVQVVTNANIFSDEKYTVSKLVRDYLNLRLMGLLKR